MKIRIYPSFVISFVALSSFLASLAFAESAVSGLKGFDLPQQSLESSLIEFGLQAGVSVVVDHELLLQYKSTPVFGKLSVFQALKQLLAGAPLEFTYNSDTQTFLVHEKKLSAELNSQKVEPSRVEEVVVTGHMSLPFRYATLSKTQFRGDSVLYDPSRFINAIPKRLIEDQQAHELSDVLKFASGVSPGDGYADTNDDLFIRGFERHAIYLDNFRVSDSTGMKIIPANIDRVEILKGPATLLFGQAEPGGIVNVVRKKPEAKTFAQISSGVGNFGASENSVDFNSQAMNGKINYRIIAADQQQNDALDLKDINRRSLLAEVHYQPTDSTSFDLGYEVQNAFMKLSRNIKVFQESQTLETDLTLEQMVKHFRPEFESKFNLFSAEMNHYLTNDWHIKVSYFWQDENRYGVRTSAAEMQKTDLLYKAGELGPNDLLLYFGGEVSIPIKIYPNAVENQYGVGHIRNLYDEQSFETVNNLNMSLDGDFSLLGFGNKFIVGAQWLKQDLLSEYFVEDRVLFENQTWPVSQLNNLLPQISSVAFDKNRSLGAVIKKPYWLVYQDYGVYVKDSVQVSDVLSLNAGVRYTETQGDSTNYFDGTSAELKTYQKLSTQTGFVFNLNSQNELFGSYSEAMRANYHLDDLGTRATQPELSYQTELGIKSSQFDGHAQFTAAIFHIRKINLAETQILNSGRYDAGFHEVDVNGIDFDTTIQFTTAFDLIFSGSKLKPSIVGGSNDGNIPALAPAETLSAALHYQIFNSWGVNVSANYIGRRFGDDSNQYSLPPYTAFDVSSIFHTRIFSKNAGIYVSIKNLLNTNYSTAVLGGVRENYAPGRSVFAKLTVDF